LIDIDITVPVGRFCICWSQFISKDACKP